jgi:hypothetical protein
MSYRYVTQRDLDGTWSVREAASDNIVVLLGATQVGLSEDIAAIRTRKLNAGFIQADTHLCLKELPLESNEMTTPLSATEVLI